MAAVAQSAPAQPSQSAGTEVVSISPADSRISYMGRVDDRDPARPRIGYPGVTIRFRFDGRSAVVRMSTDSENAYVAVILDGGEPVMHHLAKGANSITLEAKAAGPHAAEIVKRTETWQGIITFEGVTLAKDGGMLAALPLPARKLMFIGDSVTCGAGIEHVTCKEDGFKPSDGYDSYGMLLGRRLDAQAHLVCFGGRGVVRDYRGLRDVLNAPQFFDLAIAADGAQGAPWQHARFTPDGIVISLGTNDWNKQKDDPLTEQEFVGTYLKFIPAIRAQYPMAEIFLTQGSITGDPLLREWVREAVTKSHDAHVHWLESKHYPGSECDAHPTKADHRRIADDFEPEMRMVLGW